MPVLKGDLQMQELIRQIVGNFQLRGYLFDLGLKTRLFAIYYQLFTTGCVSTREGTSDEILRKLLRVLTYITGNYSKPISLNYLADLSGTVNFT